MKPRDDKEKTYSNNVFANFLPSAKNIVAKACNLVVESRLEGGAPRFSLQPSMASLLSPFCVEVGTDLDFIESMA